MFQTGMRIIVYTCKQTFRSEIVEAYDKDYGKINVNLRHREMFDERSCIQLDLEMCEELQYVWKGGDVNPNWKTGSLQSDFYQQVTKKQQWVSR